MTIIALALALAAPQATTPQAPPTPLERDLRAEDDRLLYAVHHGGRAEWVRATTPDFVYVEEGYVHTRAQLLAEMNPDGAGVLQIRDYHVVRSGDVALVMHRDEVPGTRDSPNGPATYLFTETWQSFRGRWKLHLLHVDAVHLPPPEIHLEMARLDALAGDYRRDMRSLQVRRIGDQLLVAEDEERPIHLHAETRDVFYDRDELRGRYIFEAGANGLPIRLIRRSENTDSIWMRDSR